jgi:hypothetical protein
MHGGAVPASSTQCAEARGRGLYGSAIFSVVAVLLIPAWSAIKQCAYSYVYSKLYCFQVLKGRISRLLQIQCVKGTVVVMDYDVRARLLSGYIFVLRSCCIALSGVLVHVHVAAPGRTVQCTCSASAWLAAAGPQEVKSSCRSHTAM